MSVSNFLDTHNRKNIVLRLLEGQHQALSINCFSNAISLDYTECPAKALFRLQECSACTKGFNKMSLVVQVGPSRISIHPLVIRRFWAPKLIIRLDRWKVLKSALPDFVGRSFA